MRLGTIQYVLPSSMLARLRGAMSCGFRCLCGARWCGASMGCKELLCHGVGIKWAFGTSVYGTMYCNQCFYGAFRHQMVPLWRQMVRCLCCGACGAVPLRRFMEWSVLLWRQVPAIWAQLEHRCEGSGVPYVRRLSFVSTVRRWSWTRTSTKSARSSWRISTSLSISKTWHVIV